MEGKFKITTDFLPRQVKPTSDKEKSIIYNHLTNKLDVSITEFGKLILSGCTWSGGVFNGTCTNENWQEQSVIGLDFDKGSVTPYEVVERLNGIGVNPQLWYNTFSSTNELLKFRVVLFLDVPITDRILFDYVTTTLLRLFPEADPSCKNPGRYYFGGVSTTIIKEEPISTLELINFLTINLITSDSNSFRKVPVQVIDFIKSKSAEFPPHQYNYYRTSGFSAEYNSSNKSYHPTLHCEGGKLKIDFQDLRSRFMLFDDFMKGEWLFHNQLFGLATNLYYVEGGLKLMKKTMEQFNKEGKTKYTQNNFNILPYIRKVEYFPELIEKFSPHELDWEFNNIFDLGVLKRGEVQILETPKKMSLAEAETLMREKYQEVINYGEVGKIYIFKLPTAIGKTEMILDTKATICLPTNDLKNEVKSRMKINSVVTPDRIIFTDDTLNRKIEYYYRVGLPQVATRIINSVAHDTKFINNNQTDVLMAVNYIQDLDISKQSDGAILTTHNRSFFTDFNHNTIIYDEDPLNMIVNIKEMRLSDLFSLKSVVYSTEVNQIFNDLEQSTPNQVYKFKGYGIDLESVVENSIGFKMNSNVIEFLSCQYYIRDVKDPSTIYYVTRNDFPVEKKILIMSATLPVFIYKKLYGDRVEVIDITDVEQVGQVLQHTDRSCSRAGLKHYGDEISELVGGLPVITFMTRKYLFKNSIQELHFGNCAGSDKYKGVDIAVVGTPHHNNNEYFLISAVLGLELTDEDKDLKNRVVEYNGFRFRFTCFDSEELRQIQFSLIESDLIQAVGRARTLRTNAKVELFSNFPLKGVDRF